MWEVYCPDCGYEVVADSIEEMETASKLHMWLHGHTNLSIYNTAAREEGGGG